MLLNGKIYTNIGVKKTFGISFLSISSGRNGAIIKKNPSFIPLSNTRDTIVEFSFMLYSMFFLKCLVINWDLTYLILYNDLLFLKCSEYYSLLLLIPPFRGFGVLGFWGWCFKLCIHAKWGLRYGCFRGQNRCLL